MTYQNVKQNKSRQNKKSPMKQNPRERAANQGSRKDDINQEKEQIWVEE